MHPWLRPLWRRLLLLGFLLAWLAFEFWYEGFGPWFFIVLALTIYGLGMVLAPRGRRAQR